MNICYSITNEDQTAFNTDKANIDNYLNTFITLVVLPPPPTPER